MILAYLLGGFLLGPSALRFVTDQASITTISELGLIFLLFMIGLEIDLKKIVSAGKSITYTAVAQIAGGAALGVLFFALYGKYKSRKKYFLSDANAELINTYGDLETLLAKTSEIKLVTVKTPGALPYGTVFDTKGTLWIDLFGTNKLASLDENMNITEYTLPEGARPRRIAIEARRDGGFIELRVHDNGPGVPPEARPRIFDPFFTTKPEGMGTGVGLSISRGIAAAHGGSLTLDTEATGDAKNGEVVVHGHNVMAGYHGLPEENDKVFTPDGGFRTGDMGRLDEEGFLYLVDRAKDMIIRAGENIYCVEVENVLFDFPDVLDAAIVGVPHKELGEEVKAVVQLRPGSTATAEDIRAHCRQHLADFKVPEFVEFVDAPLPRNPAGKIQKNVLRDRFRAN